MSSILNRPKLDNLAGDIHKVGVVFWQRDEKA